MSTHFKVLGWLFVVFGIVGLLVSFHVWTATTDLKSDIAHSVNTSSSKPPGVAGGTLGKADSQTVGQMAGLLTTFLRAVAVAGVVLAALMLATGIGLLFRKAWSRGPTIVLSILLLPTVMPLGTAIGIYGLWAMFRSSAPLAWDEYIGYSIGGSPDLTELKPADRKTGNTPWIILGILIALVILVFMVPFIFGVVSGYSSYQRIKAEHNSAPSSTGTSRPAPQPASGGSK